MKLNDPHLSASIKAANSQPREVRGWFCPECGTRNLSVATECSACRARSPFAVEPNPESAPVAPPQAVAPIIQNFFTTAPQPSVPPCGICGGPVTILHKSDNRAGGCIIVILGACLVPFLIGIPVLIYGLIRMGDSGGVARHCPRCS